MLDTSDIRQWQALRARFHAQHPLPSRLSKGSAPAGEAKEAQTAEDRPAKEPVLASGDFLTWCAAGGPVHVVSRPGAEGGEPGGGRPSDEDSSRDGRAAPVRFVVTLRTESLGPVQAALTVKGDALEGEIVCDGEASARRIRDHLTELEQQLKRWYTPCTLRVRTQVDVRL